MKYPFHCLHVILIVYLAFVVIVSSSFAHNLSLTDFYVCFDH